MNGSSVPVASSSVPVASPIPVARATARARARDYVSLLKLRVSWMVVFTTLAAFLLGSGAALDVVRAAFLALGTLLVGGGAMALNMAIERETDACMKRTRDRPIPAGRLRVEESVAFGVPVATAGIVVLALATNGLTAGLAALTLASYLLVYTPLKRRTPLCTLVGAVPGAMPVLMGFAAAQGRLDIIAGSLFAWLYVWQLPHFLAIAWLHREDYGKAGLPMLSVGDPEGIRTGRQTVLQTMALVAVSLAPALRGAGGAAYTLAALIGGGVFLAASVFFLLRRSPSRARAVILVSVVYLPVILGALVAGHRLGVL